MVLRRRTLAAWFILAAATSIAACGDEGTSGEKNPTSSGSGSSATGYDNTGGSGGGTGGSDGTGGQPSTSTVGSGGTGAEGGAGGEGGSGGAGGAGGENSGSGKYAWKNVTVLGGGFVSGVVFSPVEPGLVYARTDVGGAYRWNEGAKSWQPMTDWIGRADSNLTGIESLAADPTDAGKVYLAAGTYTQDWAGNGAFLRSSDQGATWQRTDVPFKMGGNEDGRSMGERLAVDPNDGNILYFASRKDGLWKSADAAATWSKVGSFPVNGTPGLGLTFIVFDPSSGAPGSATPTIYAGVADATASLYRSTNGGADWQPVAGQPTGFLASHAALDQNHVLYVSYGNGPGPNNVTDGAVWKLDTTKATWTNITPVIPGEGGWDKFGYGGLSVDAKNPGTVMVTTIDRWAAGDEIFRTIDGGATWKALGPKAQRDVAGADWLYWHGSKPSATGWMGDIDIDPFNTAHVLYVTGQGVWGSDDSAAADTDAPTHWTFRSRGLEETVALDLISPPAGAHLVSGLGDIAGFRHDDFNVSPVGGMFDNPIFGNTQSLDFAESKPELVARVGTNYSGVRGAYSEDGGATWKPFGSEPAGSSGSGSIAVTADGSRFVWAANDATPSYSTDKGATWTASAGLPKGLQVVSDRVNPGKLYSFDGLNGTVYVSSDGGTSFAAAATGLPALASWQLGEGTAQTVPGVEGDVWVTTPKGLYHSTDSGASFTPVNTTAQASSIGFGKAAPNQSYPALYLLGTVNGVVGVFRSDDTGAAWTRIDDDQHRFGWINQIIGDPRVHGRVYLGTSGRGIVYGDLE